MDVRELKEFKRRMEASLLTQLQEFERQTSCHVERIGIEYEVVLGDARGSLVAVELDVKI